MQVDGKSYGTSSVTKSLARHKMAQSKGDDKPKEMAQEGEGSMEDHQGQEGGHEAIQKTVSEHGPANTVETAKEGEHHTVKTTHEDGHKHTSKGHPSVKHVGEHIGHAAGTSESDPAEASGMEPDAMSAMGVGAGMEG